MKDNAVIQQTEIKELKNVMKIATQRWTTHHRILAVSLNIYDTVGILDASRGETNNISDGKTQTSVTTEWNTDKNKMEGVDNDMGTGGNVLNKRTILNILLKVLGKKATANTEY